MSEPVTRMQKAAPIHEHTPYLWYVEHFDYGSVVRELGSRDEPIATMSGGDVCARRANATLIAAAPALLAYAEKSLPQLIAERDCYYEGCADADGLVPDIEDQMTLDHYDRDIDALRALIAAAKGDA